MRTLNRYVTEHKPWELAKDDAKADELDQVLFDLADGLRAVAVALVRLPAGDGSEDPRRARPAARARLGAGRLRPLRPADGIEAAPPLFPRIEPPADADAA